MKKIQCQLIASVNTPPASSPIDPPADATNPYTPIALACSPGAGNIVTIIPKITAEVSAPPTPCTNRAPINTPCDGATAHASDATVNTANPARNTRRCPTRSPNRPASNNNPPNGIK
jgi:hypothetical protein